MASAGPTPAVDIFQRQFDDAQNKFKKELSDAKCDPKILQEIFRMKNKNDVLLALEQLQEKQKTRGTWLHLERISPLIDRLQSYVAVIDRFVQVKPDILALVWGPISLVLLWTSEVRAAFNAVIDVTMSLGQRLPQFEDVAMIFSDKDRIKSFLSLIYKDILEFHLTALKYFSSRKWKMFLDATWALQKEKFQKIEERIDTHLGLLRDETTFQHIQQAHSDARESMKRFDKLATGQNQQFFQSLQVEMRPRNFATTLDWLRCRAVEGTGTWLMENETFAQLLVFNEQSPKHVWIQGIPGAGKTFLAYWIVTEAQKQTGSKTAYLFASHRDSDTTALSLIHSLLFQLAADDADLQIALINSNAKDWKYNTFTATVALQKAVAATGQLFVIVDGLDEVDESERKIFLQQLLKVSSACAKLKICICSRLERDIENLFGEVAVSISVNKNNSRSIRTYTEQRYTDWMQEAQFTAEAQIDIYAPFSVIATRCEGMFLYARVVIDNVVSLNDVQEIMAELKSLPRDLQEAYSRIFQRINNLPSPRCRRARRVLSWMQCAPAALQIQEIEQGLLVTKERHDVPIVESSIDVLKDCGPIVEILDDQLQFVHFSAKEYLLQHRSETHIDPFQAAFDLLTTCTTYLSHNAINETSNDDILRNIAKGKYRFAKFAYFYWFALIQRCIKLSDGPDDIAKIAYLLEEFFDIRSNHSFEPHKDENQENLLALNEFPDAQNHFKQALSFEAHVRRDSWRLTADDGWTNHDPTTISKCMVRIEIEYEKLYRKTFCREKYILQEDLVKHYGQHLFRCSFLNCPRCRIGFATRKDWADHLECHDRPLKCTFPGCLYATIGFISKFQMTQHMEQHMPMQVVTGPTTDSSLNEGLIPLLFELVENHNAQEFQKVWPIYKDTVRQRIATELTIRAAERGCLPIVQCVLNFHRVCRLDPDGQPFPPSPSGRDCADPNCDHFQWVEQEQRFTDLASAMISTENSALEDWFLSNTLRWFAKFPKNKDVHIPYRRLVTAVMSSPSLRVTKLWKTKIQNAVANLKHNVLLETFTSPALKSAEKNPINENELCSLIRHSTQSGHIDRNFLGYMLIHVARFSQSIQLASCLLDLGAPIDFPLLDGQPIDSSCHISTPLHHASRKLSKRAAEFVKFLLVHGADPNVVYRRKKPCDGAGARQISQWLGMDWNNLTAWAREEKERLIQLGGTRGQQIQNRARPLPRTHGRIDRR